MRPIDVAAGLDGAVDPLAAQAVLQHPGPLHEGPLAYFLRAALGRQDHEARQLEGEHDEAVDRCAVRFEDLDQQVVVRLATGQLLCERSPPICRNAGNGRNALLEGIVLVAFLLDFFGDAELQLRQGFQNQVLSAEEDAHDLLQRLVVDLSLLVDLGVAGLLRFGEALHERRQVRGVGRLGPGRSYLEPERRSVGNAGYPKCAAVVTEMLRLFMKVKHGGKPYV